MFSHFQGYFVITDAQSLSSLFITSSRSLIKQCHLRGSSTSTAQGPPLPASPDDHLDDHPEPSPSIDKSTITRVQRSRHYL